MALRIPEKDHDKLAELVRLDAATLDVLHHELEVAPPRLRVSELVADLVPKVTLSRVQLQSVLSVLVTLSWLVADQQLTPTALAEQLIQAIAETKDTNLQIPPNEVERFKTQLVKLLELDRTLGVTSKALYIAHQFPCHYHDVRIFTDTRPVFTRDSSEPPAAFIVNHTLQLQIHDNGDEKEWYLSLNTEDLVGLKAAIDRALEKEGSLRQVMEKTGVPLLNWKETCDDAT
jgi:hypothetical protein